MHNLSRTLKAVTAIVESLEEGGVAMPDVIIDSDTNGVTLDWFVSNCDNPAEACASVGAWAATLGDRAVSKWQVGPSAALAHVGPGLTLRIFYGGELERVGSDLRATVKALG